MTDNYDYTFMTNASQQQIDPDMTSQAYVLNTPITQFEETKSSKNASTTAENITTKLNTLTINDPTYKIPELSQKEMQFKQSYRSTASFSNN